LFKFSRNMVVQIGSYSGCLSRFIGSGIKKSTPSFKAQSLKSTGRNQEIAAGNRGVTLVVLSRGGSWSRLRRSMGMVEYFANTPASAFGNFACALSRADADVLAGNTCTLADIAGGVEWVQRNKVTRTFPNPFGRRSSALCGPFANVSGAPAYLATRAALLGLLPGSPRRIGSLWCRLGLAVLTEDILAADGNCECQKRNA
jgi:hypothetical protein